MEKLFEVRRDEWAEELKGHKEFFEKFGRRLSPELWRQYEALGERLQAEVPP